MTNLEAMSRIELEDLVTRLDELERRECRERLAQYTRRKLGLDPAVHHEYLLDKLEAVLRGEIKRLMVLMPPGTAKSTYSSLCFPEWYLGHKPHHKIIGASHSEDLAEDFGRAIRNTINSEDYAGIFCDTLISGDNKSARKWSTSKHGGYYGVGVGGSVTGRRADLGLLDDPFRGRRDADSKIIRDATWGWYKADFRTRLKPNAPLIVINTRWHQDDLCGRILPVNWDQKSGWVKAQDGEMWFVVNIPACAEEDDVIGRKPGEWLSQQNYNPITKDREEYFPVVFWEQERFTQGPRNWNALYQQRPTDEDGAIIKRSSWKKYPHDVPPSCFYVLQSYDTAFEEGEEDDYTARTTWGLFMHPGPDGVERVNLILLERLKKKLAFPDLRKEAVDSYKAFNPDRVLIEKKASGHSLIQELRRAQVPVKAWNPDKIGKKLARAHAASVVFEQGLVWHMDRRWADEVIDECAAFPNAAHDDMVDCVTQALIWVRRIFHLKLVDEEDEDEIPKPKDRKIYG